MAQLFHMGFLLRVPYPIAPDAASETHAMIEICHINQLINKLDDRYHFLQQRKQVVL